MKVSVIGGGPAGSIAALNGVREHDVTLYEEHKKQPIQCAGLISKTGLMRLGIKLKKQHIKNTVYGAKIFSPSEESFLIEGKNPKAYVIDRGEFDQFLLDQATDKGATVINKRVKDLNGIDADRIILATGTNYQLQRKIGVNSPKRFLVGAQYEIDFSCDPRFVELHFNIPEFFSWIIPLKDRVRIGCCSNRNPVPYLDRFIKKLTSEGRIKNLRIHKKNFGIIPLHEPKLKTDYGKVVTVGDAAGQVKATTGGGVILGGLAATFTCRPDYERCWKSAIGKELNLHLRVHNIMANLSDQNKNRLFSLISCHKQILEEKGDMDIASKAVYGMFRNPAFTARFIYQLPYYLVDLFF